ncbi:hypothetical protein CC85DRAFT_289190 [Cutaneotrichosporon oleaginosum]|uniref:WHIM1 domain-containing protein n=1 Tax=Cutaneotrichosporon oleaginosum TaxID=879819 RepID=A0A0J0XCH7_9TREE|nr:uncharacterized protein CC85DRAFT_289190 [Cutaneotrichosporon oleaginosum]KLT38783.1 hypothetical protein CC85DRAFT_289190 [Cutaneotrichosporon oleaginosum]TXT09942.1 hypothetical protein COLE_03876 [Cutaneotrichosporon oleaginosum]
MPPSAPRASSSAAGARSNTGSRAGTPGALQNTDEATRGVKEDPDGTPVEDGSSIARAAAQSRHEADLAHHAYEPPRPERVQDDWQVAYVWAFIVKFGLLPRIGSLLSLEEFERSLCEPVANRPDDVLEGVLIAFLKNLKPGLRNLDCTNIQSHLSNYISDMLLNSTEFTVWDRPWAPHEEARGDCCNKSADRMLLGRLRGPNEEKQARVKKNPIAQMEKKGGGIFELDWYERARLLRQLVDWQLSHSDVIREKVKEAQAKKDEANKKKLKRKNPDADEEKVDKNADIWIEPVGLDRNKNRIWSIDKSARLYKSGNPFKRPCPLVTMTSTRDELQRQMETFKVYGEAVIPKPKGSGPKGKTTQKEALAHRRQIKGVEDEKRLGEWIEQFLPDVEKEEARVARARKKNLDTMRILQAAELRTTRTRRSTRKVDYTYGSMDEEEDELPRRGGRRGAAPAAYEPPRKPAIPGERRSGRLQARVDAEEYEDQGIESYAPSREISPPPSSPPPPAVYSEGAKATQGYTSVDVPGSSPDKVNGNGLANGKAHEGGADEPMVVDQKM